MSNKVILHATDLDGYLTDNDKAMIDSVQALYSEYLDICSAKEKSDDPGLDRQLTDRAAEIGHTLERICEKEPQIHVYSFETPDEQHGAASRLIAKLRHPSTGHEEFLYYIQRAYEMLFAHTYCDKALKNKRSLIEKTPVSIPCQNYAVHRIPDVDSLIHDSVMCVMLRGALLPSMIISKEIQDYSSDDFITPFALFRIKRDDTRKEKNMDYVLDLDRSFFSLGDLDGKDLIFADPMNATGGSLVTIIKYLESQGVKPRSVKFINVISALKGALRIARAIPNAEIYTLWMDPVLNEKAYILPGLGDAGDRLNGVDGEVQRNMLLLIADYGQSIVNLYRDQVREIEKTVLG
ncbi:MAG: uracil phosphoribosyltransferase [Bullifex sp.]